MNLKEGLKRVRNLPPVVAAEKKAAKKLIPKLSEAFEYCSAIKTEFEEGALAEIVQQVKAGNQLVIVGPHKSHIDGVVLGRNVVRPLKPLFDDEGWKVAMIVTGAFQTGNLGPFLQVMSSEMDVQAKQQGIDEVWPIIRPKDLANGMKKTPEHNTSLRNMLRSAQNKYVEVFFAEGTVQGGRQVHLFNPFDNATYGMQEPLTDTLGRMVGWAEKAGRGVTFLPVAITGTNKVFSPDLTSPTLKALAATYLKRNLGTVRVKVGRPLDGKELLEKAERECVSKEEAYAKVSSHVLEHIAGMLPEDERGVYKGANFYSE